MTTTQAVLDHNAYLIADARRYVRQVAAALAAVRLSADPRFTIHYEGFGTGGTAGVTDTGADRFLRELGDPNEMHARHLTRIKNVEITFTVAAANFIA